MSNLATIWLILKWLMIIAFATGCFVALIGLFHPLKFSLKIRGSRYGQRAEIWFVYLFRILKIGVVATPHTQDVILKFFFWKKVLQRNQRKKPKTKPTEHPEPTAKYEESVETAPNVNIRSSQPIFDTEKQAPAADSTPATEDTVSKKEDEVTTELKGSEKADSTNLSDIEELKKPTDEKPFPEKDSAEVIHTEKTEADKSEPVSPPAQKLSPETVEPTIKTEVETTEAEPLKSVSDIDPFAEKDKQFQEVEHETKKHEPGLGSKLRQLKKKTSEKYRESKRWIKIALNKYKLLSPILWKFYYRSKKGISIVEPTIVCRYALHKPYLTGMFQGNLAILSGMMQRFGINFIPVPVFSQPTVYAKASVGAVLHPYRFVFAFIALMVEKTLWLEAWKLFKFYRSIKSGK
ncbi:MAG: hypothetical protein Kow0029_08540 [Candidatus Rifleibacteriota bacterium]